MADRDPCLYESGFEGEAASDEESHEVGMLRPGRSRVGDLLDQFPVAPDAVPADVGADVAAGREP